MMYHQKKESIAVFQKRAASLKESADVLEEGIASMRRKIMETNERTFRCVAIEFRRLSSKLLPHLELDLHMQSEDLMDGVVMSFRKADAACGDSEGVAWSSNLKQLSGGQRTLLSLALLMAAAQAGGRCSLFLMDEVSIALWDPESGADPLEYSFRQWYCAALADVGPCIAADSA
eukprot:evm.model.scf_739.5 EVM.evm.TU.scf_739.5   scf_739:54932-57829(-)